jgi:hypothetical protein
VKPSTFHGRAFGGGVEHLDPQKSNSMPYTFIVLSTLSTATLQSKAARKPYIGVETYCESGACLPTHNIRVFVFGV